MNQFVTSTLTLAALAAVVPAQGVDFIVTNIGSGGAYSDAVVQYPATGAARPMVSEATGRGATNSVRKAKLRNIGGKNYLYWYNTFLNGADSEGLFRGTDANLNGVIDASETQQVFSTAPATDGQFDEMNGDWWISCASGSAGDRGIWRCKDNNNDGDFMDTGESNRLVNAPTITIGATTYSSDDARTIAFMANGDCIWAEEDARMWFRTTPAGVTSVFLVYLAPTVISGPAPALNADFANSTLPAVTARLNRVAVDTSTDTVYMAVNFYAPEAYIFACKDGNNDGDVQDAGEVKLVFDGSAATPAWGPIDDIDFLNGTVYGSFEIDPANDGRSQFWSWNATAGATMLGTTAAGDDPTALGVSVVPAGTFGPSCVSFEVQNDVDFQSAGGNITFTAKNIPSNLQNNGTQMALLLSLTGTAPLPFGNCIIGISPDALTSATIGSFIAGPVTANTQSFPMLPYPANLPPGTTMHYTAVAITGITIPALSGSGFVRN